MKFFIGLHVNISVLYLVCQFYWQCNPYTHCINSLGLLFVPVVHSMVWHLGDYLPSMTEMCIPHMFEVLAVKSSQLSLCQELAFSWREFLCPKKITYNDCSVQGHNGWVSYLNSRYLPSSSWYKWTYL